MRVPGALARLTHARMPGRLSRGHKIAVAAGVCALLTAVLVASLGSANGSVHTALPAAKSLTLHSLGRSGPELSLTQYRGRAVVINFFASWCGPCKKETPLLASFFRAHHGHVPILGVDVNDNAGAATRFIRAAGVGYPVGSDPAGAAASRYGVVGIPQTFFLNAGHHIVKRVFGAVTLAELNSGLARMR
jgi:thiol-disulfide isomerase/thioredoxin